MQVSYLKLALRLLARNPFFTFINVAGLSIGFAVFFILWQYSQAELSSDRFHKDSSRIVTLMAEVKSPTFEVSQYRNLHPVFGPALSEGMADIEDATRIIAQTFFNSSICVDHDDNIYFSYWKHDKRHDFIEHNVIYADENLFQFFNFPLLTGEPGEVLRKTNSIVISKSIAAKYFGNETPIDKTIYLNNSIPFVVTGVFADLPGNTHMAFDMVLPMNRIARSVEMVDPMQLTTRIYLKHKPIQPGESLEARIETFLRLQFSGLFAKYGTGLDIRFWLIPLHELPFSPYAASPKSKFYLVALGAIGLVILGMAWVNYVNLSAHLTKR